MQSAFIDEYSVYLQKTFLSVLLIVAVKLNADDIQFETTFGKGDGLSELGSIAINNARDIFVADSRNHRVQKFSSSGFLLATIGSMGTDSGKFQSPYGIAIDSSGNIIVADTLTWTSHNQTGMI